MPVAVFTNAVFLQTLVTNHCYGRAPDDVQLPDTAICFNYVEIYKTV